MPVILTPISISADEIAESKAYFDQKLHTTKWSLQTDSDITKALFSANELINQFNYLGYKTSSTQYNEWPRSGLIDSLGSLLPSDVIPDDIYKAKWEIAYALLIEGRESERDMRTAYVTSRGFSSVRTTYNSAQIPEYLQYGIPSGLAWAYLSPYLNRGSSGIIRIYRV